jgi:hypothetical protein
VTTWLDRVGLSADEWTDTCAATCSGSMVATSSTICWTALRRRARDLVETARRRRHLLGAPSTRSNARFAGRARARLRGRRRARSAGSARTAARRRTIRARRSWRSTHAHWLSVANRHAIPSRGWSTACGIERRSLRVAEASLEGRLSAIVDDNRLAWMRLEIATLSFATEAAAREALLCVEGRRPLAPRRRGAVALRRSAAVVTLDDLEPARQELLLAAEPARRSVRMRPRRFDVALLVNRSAPALSDPAIAARATAVAVDRANGGPNATTCGADAVLFSGPLATHTGEAA